MIIEEIRMYEDSPPFGADDRCKAAYFGAHPLARSILGTVRSITDLDVEAMRDYFRRRYSPGNVALIATGRVDFDALVKTAERRAAARNRDADLRKRDCADARRPRRDVAAFRGHSQGRRHATIRHPTRPRPGRRKPPSATPPSCWPTCSATTRAAGCTGS